MTTACGAQQRSGVHAIRGACAGRGAPAPVVDRWQWLVRLTTRAMSSRSALRSVAVPAMADS